MITTPVSRGRRSSASPPAWRCVAGDRSSRSCSATSSRSASTRRSTGSRSSARCSTTRCACRSSCGRRWAARRGYGPTHSQTLEKVLLGVPGITVVAPSECHDIGSLLPAAIADDDPVFLIENKLMYGRPNRRPVDGRAGRPAVPRDRRAATRRFRSPATASRRGGDDDRHLRRDAADRARGGRAADHRGRGVHRGGRARAGCCRSTSSRCSSRSAGPARSSRSRRGRSLAASAPRSRRACRARPGTICARPVERIAARDGIIPAAPTLEEAVLPGVDDVVSAVRALGIVRS